MHGRSEVVEADDASVLLDNRIANQTNQGGGDQLPPEREGEDDMRLSEAYEAAEAANLRVNQWGNDCRQRLMDEGMTYGAADDRAYELAKASSEFQAIRKERDRLDRFAKDLAARIKERRGRDGERLFGTIRAEAAKAAKAARESRG